MKYNMNQWSTNHNILKENDEIVLLGLTLTTKDISQTEKKNKILAELFINIIWISYRKNFSPLIPSHFSSEFRSDTGWGCMIRVGIYFEMKEINLIF